MFMYSNEICITKIQCCVFSMLTVIQLNSLYSKLSNEVLNSRLFLFDVEGWLYLLTKSLKKWYLFCFQEEYLVCREGKSKIWEKTRAVLIRLQGCLTGLFLRQLRQIQYSPLTYFALIFVRIRTLECINTFFSFLLMMS